MATFRADFFFREFNQGWTETWYKSGSGIETVADLAVVLMQENLLEPRVSTVVSQGIRVVQVDPPVPRITAVRPAPGFGDRPQVAFALENADVVQTAILLRYRTSDGGHKSQLVRGLLDTDVIRTAMGASAPSAQLRTALNVMFAGIKDTSWLVRRLVTTLPPTVITLAEAHPTVPAWTRITASAAFGLAAGDTVVFYKIPLRDLPWLKGKWVVTEVAGATFSIGYTWPRAGSYSFSRSSVRKVTYTYLDCTDMTVLDFRIRKTGKGLVPTRGRSRGVRFRG